MKNHCFIVSFLIINIEYRYKYNNINFKLLSRMKFYTTAFKLSPKSKKIDNLNVTSNSLVVWGSNLGLTIGKKLSRIQANMTKIPLEIQSIIVGLLLSDGWMQIPSNSINARLGFKQSAKNSSYVWSVFSKLNHYCSNFPYRTTGTRKGKTFFGLAFQTRQLPCLTIIHNLFYIKNKKVIPSNIYDLLTPIALAHWIMGDGSGANRGLVLCTDCYTLKQTILLLNVLVIKYELDCSLWSNNSNWRIYIKHRSIPKLKSIVIDHMHPSMLYKLKV